MSVPTPPAPYILLPGEGLATGMARALGSQYDTALESLALAANGDDDAIHTARKTTKRLRAMLRMVRPGTGADAYRRENTELRELSRAIAPARDSHVLVQTFSTLAYPDAADRALPLVDGIPADILADLALAASTDRRLEPPSMDGIASLEARLVAGHHEAVAAVTEPEAIARMTATLTVCRDRALLVMSALPNSPIDPLPDIVTRGMGRTYRRTRRDHQRSLHSTSDEPLHRWRKGVKYLRHQLETTERMIMPEQASAIGELDTLGDLLGFHHDVEMLIHHADAGPPESASGLLFARSRFVQDRLRHRALSLVHGAGLFSRSRRRFEDDLIRAR